MTPRGRAARVAVVVLAGAGLAWGGHAGWEAIQTWGTPTCSWPMQVRGTASRDTAGLLAVAADIPPVRITSADLRYSADAHAGPATASFTPNPEDTTSASVTITYADGVRETAYLMNMARPRSTSREGQRAPVPFYGSCQALPKKNLLDGHGGQLP